MNEKAHYQKNADANAFRQVRVRGELLGVAGVQGIRGRDICRAKPSADARLPFLEQS
jgi:hypothetical protein